MSLSSKHQVYKCQWLKYGYEKVFIHSPHQSSWGSYLAFPWGSITVLISSQSWQPLAGDTWSHFKNFFIFTDKPAVAVVGTDSFVLITKCPSKEIESPPTPHLKQPTVLSEISRWFSKWALPTMKAVYSVTVSPCSLDTFVNMGTHGGWSQHKLIEPLRTGDCEFGNIYKYHYFGTWSHKCLKYFFCILIRKFL